MGLMRGALWLHLLFHMVLSRTIKPVIKDASELDERLLQATVQGNVQEVQKALYQGADVNSRDNGVGSTPLIWAALKGHTEVMRHLLKV